MKFLEQLRRHYETRGFTVFSRHFATLDAVPPNWQGPAPDMFVEKADQRIAIIYAGGEMLKDPEFAGRWKRACEESDCRLKIFLRETRALQALQRVVKEEHLPAEVVPVSREHVRRRRFRISRRAALIWIAVAAISFLLLWFGSYLYDYNPTFYEPRDEERSGQRP